ncbi:MAG TPA: TonB-dependent receptor [Polyangia bacterium]|nr:TonB-dependent receptor [Polyangia bacterium]
MAGTDDRRQKHIDLKNRAHRPEIRSPVSCARSFSADGVPINDSGNVHGNGYADTHFIIPELILGLRVTEGPFSPYQGNYAVAGSADYHLGLEARGTTAKATYGSWNTRRVLLLWGPAGASPGTFGGVDAYRTDGFGVNRAATRTSAMAQYEIGLPSGASLRVGGQAYATHFQAAGVVRQDDWQSGRVGFFGTEDPLQGGDASRFSAYLTYDRPAEWSALQQSLFLIRRDVRLREDITGLRTDTQNELDTLHGQRGDLIDMSDGAWTLGGPGLARWSTLVRGLRQSIDVGYLARLDLINGTQYRDTVPGNIPYKVETALQSTITDVGLYADASLRPWRWLTLRGGARVDTFSYDVLNLCAAQGDFDNPSRSRPPTNESCHDQMQLGAHREPVQRSSTGAVKLMPRVTATIGPIRHFNLSLSYGEGVRSIDPAYIPQDLATPFASVRAYEGGVTYTSNFRGVDVSARSIFFATKVDHDLVFSQTTGSNVLANGTTRLGWAAALRLLGSFFDEAANLTLVRPTFDDTHHQISYVPTLVFREDGALFRELPWNAAGRPFRTSLGVGWTYVGRRALPYNQQSDVISVVDATASVAMGGWEISLAVTNLFDRRYRLGEFNYASDFGCAPEPTLIPARHFTAGAPRGVFVSLSGTFGGAS